MILKAIIEHINTQMESLEYFRYAIGLCELVEKEEKLYPAYFKNGEHHPVKLDSNETYCRKTGTVRVRNIDSDTSTEDYQERTYPIRVVAQVLRRNIEETIFSADYLADLIIQKLTANSIKTLSTLTGAENIRIEVLSYNTNPFEVWAEEFRGVEMNADYTENLLVALDLEITITGAVSCFEL